MTSKKRVGAPPSSVLDNELIPARELAAMLDVKLGTLGDWRRDHRGPSYIERNRRYWYARSAVEAWLRAGEHQVPGSGVSS